MQVNSQKHTYSVNPSFSKYNSSLKGFSNLTPYRKGLKWWTVIQLIQQPTLSCNSIESQQEPQ